MRRILYSGLSVCALLATLALGAREAHAEQGYFVAGEAGVSYLSEWSAGRLKPGTAALSARAGYRWENWDVFGVANQSFWLDQQFEGTIHPVLNLGVGLGLNHIDGHVRSSVRLGTSILLFNTELTQAGEMGAFIEIRPAGFRLPVAEDLTVEIHPLGFALTSPVLTEIPLFKASYRTSVGVEAKF